MTDNDPNQKPKPLKELKMAPPKDAPKKPAQTPSKGAGQQNPDGGPQETINDASFWDKIRKGWAQEQDKMHSRAMAQFDHDDDLPMAKHYLLIAIVSFVVGLLVWMNFASLDEVTRGEGKVVPSSDVQAIQSLDAGTVEEILVREGSMVEAGQPLMRLNAIEASSDLDANRARYLGLLASITRLQAEAEGKDTVEFPEEVMSGTPTSVTEELNAFRANKLQVQGQQDVLRQQISQREQELRELNTRASDARGVISLQRQEAEMIRPLVAAGSAPKLELLQLERGIKEKSSELNGYLSGIPRAQAAIEEAEARLKSLENDIRAEAQAELSAKLIELNEIKERLSALQERKGRTELRSPVGGTIQEITIHTIGGVVRPGEDLIKIVPKDDQLIVEAKIKPSDRAFIFPGQKAMVKITAYDFSIYGGLEGEVIDISADTIEDEQRNSYYRVRVRTFETELKRKGEILPITTGMVATVDILTGKKTVMQYLLKPLRKTLDVAMSER